MHAQPRGRRVSADIICNTIYGNTMFDQIPQTTITNADVIKALSDVPKFHTVERMSLKPSYE